VLKLHQLLLCYLPRLVANARLKTRQIYWVKTFYSVVGADYDAAVQRIMDLGYSKEEVVAAMKASFNNPDRAVEYLFSGIPSSELDENPEGLRQTDQSANSSNAFDFLRNDPQFRQLRQAVLQNPELLQPLMQQIGASNPRLLELITQNQEEFLNLMNEGGDEESDLDDGAANDGSNPASFIQVSPEEKEALDRVASV
jgi:UV excision repair protein RAD23